MNRRKLEHGFRMISPRIPSVLPQEHEGNDVPTFWRDKLSPFNPVQRTTPGPDFSMSFRRLTSGSIRK